MMNWKYCGKYIDRVVQVAGIASLEEFIANSSLSSSLLLLCFNNCKTNTNEISAFLEKVVPLNPLAIIIAGKCATDYFDEVLNYLDSRSGRLQIMTGVNESSNQDDWQTEFLQATWPAEERFDGWNEYAVVAIGDTIFQEQVYSIFREATQQTGSENSKR